MALVLDPIGMLFNAPPELIFLKLLTAYFAIAIIIYVYCLPFEVVISIFFFFYCFGLQAKFLTHSEAKQKKFIEIKNIWQRSTFNAMYEPHKAAFIFISYVHF